MRNVGKTDRIFRFLLGLFLIWLGLFSMDGLHGDLIGIFIAATSLMPFYMAFTASCFVFRLFKIHSLNDSECGRNGKPYSSESSE